MDVLYRSVYGMRLFTYILLMLREERRQKIREEKRGIRQAFNYNYFRGKAAKSASAVNLLKSQVKRILSISLNAISL